MKKLNTTLLINQLNELALQGPLFIIMIGAPGSGKSTFIKALGQTLKFTVGSTDDQIDAYAEKHGITYSQAFTRINFKHLKKQMMEDINAAARVDRSVVIDQTNMGRKQRKDKLALAGPNHVKVAIVFEVPEKELFERLEKREAATGKGVPKVAVYSMLKNYEAPTRDEGFDFCFELTQ